MSDADVVTAAFVDRTGHPPSGVWAAPGRVNLIGEHTDYNEGFVMPFGLAQRVTVAAGPRDDDRWRVASLNNSDTATFSRYELNPGMSGWASYIAGVVWALEGAGHRVEGADLVLTSDVPVGAGLSSSAALECAVLTALVELNGLEISPIQRAQLAQRAENEFVGAPTGLMDQAAATLCTAEHALFFDCRSNEAEQVALDLAGSGFELLVLDTKTPHALVDSEYATRRRSCEQAAQLLGVPALRDVTDLDLALSRMPDAVTARRVRHVVTENARVLQAADVLRAGRTADLAPLLNASHTSMRNDFEITVPTVDLAVEAARDAGALGARMTGGGFGGCIIALVPAGTAPDVARQISDRFAAADYGPPEYFIGHPSAGAARVR
ncbi:MAG TPA: galactokinase [Propionibacteriaceae bacterium]|nr:galactokinase [Propionibacteriaceae bacterium]